MKKLLLASALCLGLAGCNAFIPPSQSDPTRFYVLANPSLPQAGALPQAGTLRLGLRRVEVSSYLEGRQIVVRNGNEVALEEYERWAEPLGQSIGRILRTELELQPEVKRVDLQSSGESEHDEDISVEVLRCEGAAAGGRHVARFAALIRISTGGAEPHEVARRMYAAPDAPWDGKDFSRLAALLSEDVAGLAKEIVAAIPR